MHGLLLGLLAIITQCACDSDGEDFGERVERLATTPLHMLVNDHPADAVLSVTRRVHSFRWNKGEQWALPWGALDQCYNGDAASCGRDFFDALDGTLQAVRGEAGRNALARAAAKKYRAMSEKDEARGVQRHVLLLLGRVGSDVPHTHGIGAVQLVAAMEALLSRPGWTANKDDDTDATRRTVGLGRIMRLQRRYVPGRMRDEYVAIALLLGMHRTADALMAQLEIRVSSEDNVDNWGRFAKDQPLSMALLVGRVDAGDRKRRRWMRDRLVANVAHVVKEVLETAKMDAPGERRLCADGGLEGTDERRDRLRELDAACDRLDDQYERAIVARAYLHVLYGVSLLSSEKEQSAYEDAIEKAEDLPRTSDIARKIAERICASS